MWTRMTEQDLDWSLRVPFANLPMEDESEKSFLWLRLASSSNNTVASCSSNNNNENKNTAVDLLLPVLYCIYLE